MGAVAYFKKEGEMILIRAKQGETADKAIRRVAEKHNVPVGQVVRLRSRKS